MKDIFSVDCRKIIRSIAKKELKEKFGIKSVHEKVVRQSKKIQTTAKVFGVSLQCVPTKYINCEESSKVPIFLEDAFQFLKKHLEVEGLFRKSGSVNRQRILRDFIERDGSCCSCEFAQPHDVAALVKQFFRELPDPLLTNRLTPTFLKCAGLTNNSDAVSSLVLCCLLLPDDHLRLLKYFSSFINTVANHSLQSKMTLNNLAIVFAPNLMCSLDKDTNNEKSMKEFTHAVNMLFKNYHLIGMVPDAIFNKAKDNYNDAGFLSSSGDELDTETVNERVGRTLARSEKKRDRSKSITSFLKRSFKPEKSTHKHLRANSEKSTLRISKNSLKKRNLADSLRSSEDEKEFALEHGRSLRKISPVRKSPRLLTKDQSCVTISKPTLMTIPSHILLTPRRYLTPIQKENDSIDGCKTDGRMRIFPVGITRLNAENKVPITDCVKMDSLLKTSSDTDTAPSKTYDDEKSSHLDDSNTIISYRDSLNIAPNGKLPQSRINRNSQKPHVQKSNREVARRRAKYSSARSGKQLPKISPNSTSTSSMVTSAVHDENTTTPRVT